MKAGRMAALAAVVLLMAGCNGKDSFPKFLEDDRIRLEIDGRTLFEYDGATCQLGFNRDLHQFRVHTDNMSDYFTITLSGLPSDEGETLRGDIVWTTDTDVRGRKDVALEAVRLEGDKIWLWDDKSRIAAVVQVLE